MLYIIFINLFAFQHIADRPVIIATYITNNIGDKTFVELGGGVDDVPGWCRDGAYVKLGFR